MILVTGAGGKTGKMLIKALSNIESVCAFVYRNEHVSAVKSSGAEKVIVGDMRDQSTIRSAMQGMRSVYHICPNMSPNEVGIGKMVIDEARDAGVEHFVYHSVLHPQTEKMKHHWGKLRVEEIIFESGLPFTIIQPAPYMQNLLAGWQSIIEKSVLRVPYSVESKFSFIDLEDLAEAAKIVLTESNHKNAIYELSGTNPISHIEVAEKFSRALKRDVRAEEEQVVDWKLRASTALAHLPWRTVPGNNAHSAQREDYVIENLVKMFEYYDQWGLVGNSNVLRWLLNREPTSVELFIAKTVKERNVIH